MVNFGKYLARNSLAEWQEHYVQYETLKNMVDDIEAHRARREAEALASAGGSGLDLTRNIPIDPDEDRNNMFSVLNDHERTLQLGPANDDDIAAEHERMPLLRCLTPAVLAPLAGDEPSIRAEQQFVRELDSNRQRVDAWFQKQLTYFSQQLLIIEEQMNRLSQTVAGSGVRTKLPTANTAELSGGESRSHSGDGGDNSSGVEDADTSDNRQSSPAIELAPMRPSRDTAAPRGMLRRSRTVPLPETASEEKSEDGEDDEHETAFALPKFSPPHKGTGRSESPPTNPTPSPSPSPSPDAPSALGGLARLRRGARTVLRELQTMQIHASLQMRLISSVKPWRAVCTALKELYRGLTLLAEFKSLNFTALSKILKKHDKHSPLLLHGMLGKQINATPIFSSQALLQLTLQTEETFARAYSCAHSTRPATATGRDAGLSSQSSQVSAVERKAALLQLRPGVPRMSHMVTFRLGVLVGLSLCLFIVLMFLGHFVALRTGTTIAVQLSPVLPVYRGLFLVILHLWAWSFNVYLFHRHRINYAFIFELDRKTELTYPQVMEAAAWLLFMWFVSLDLFLATTLLQDFWPNLNPGYFHAVLYGALLLGAICPFDILARPTRLYVAKTLWAILTTGWGPVAFAHFYTCNQLCSLVNVLNDLSYGLCFYFSGDFLSSDPTYCKSFQSDAMWVLPFLPYWYRCLQCLKRWRDSDNKKQLLNAGKYALSLNTSLWSNLNKHFPNGGFVNPWIVCAVTSTLASYMWDVKCDWGLMEMSPHALDWKQRLLRRRRVLRSAIPYTIAIVSDAFMRLAWTATISAPGSFGVDMPPDWWKTIIYSVEVIRRNQWNFYRLENEHLTNVDSHRCLNINVKGFGTGLVGVTKPLIGSARLLSNEKPKQLKSGDDKVAASAPPPFSLTTGLPVDSSADHSPERPAPSPASESPVAESPATESPTIEPIPSNAS